MSDLLQFIGEVSIQAAADGQRTPRVSILAYGGGEMKVGGFGPVAVDLAGADVGGDIPLLADHATTLDNIAGQGLATIRNQQLYVEGILTEATTAGQKVLALARSGISLQASIGYVPDRREQIAPSQKTAVNGRTLTAGPSGLTIIRSGRLREVSLLPIGADADTQVSIAASAAQSKGTRTMSQETTTIIPDDMRFAWDREGMSDDERIEARLDRFRRDYGDTLPDFGRGMVRAAASGSLSWADAEREILRAEVRAMQLRAIRAERPTGPEIHGSRTDAGGPDVLQASLLLHLGADDVAVKAFGDRATQIARDARMGSLVEILQAAFVANGQDAPRNRNDMIRAAFSTANIANIVSGVQNKILLDQWARLPMTWPTLCKKIAAADFKQSKAVRLVGRDAMLDEIGAAGEIKHGHLQDSAATYQISTYARMYAVTRQDIINDDLGALDELPRIIARGAGLKMESVFWSLVLGNADDFFGETNGNLLSDVLDLTGLGAAVAVMRNLVDADGEPVLVEPRTLVVPPALETTADQLFASTNVVMAGTGEAVTTAPSASPFAGKYKPQTSPYISNSKYTGNSDTQWYLFADPNAGPAAFLAAFLDGVQAPTIEQSDTDFNTLGVQYRGFLDFGFAQCDSQGAVKSTGLGE